jgi:hypothetical protein
MGARTRLEQERLALFETEVAARPPRHPSDVTRSLQRNMDLDEAYRLRWVGVENQSRQLAPRRRCLRVPYGST